MIKILILEDEEILLHLYKKNLEKHGFEVLGCKTVSESKKTIENFTPNIALIDHGIKNENASGIDFLPTLRQKFPDLKIIMLSNYSDISHKEQAIENGADEYLIKLNISPKTLPKIIEKFIEEI